MKFRFYAYVLSVIFFAGILVVGCTHAPKQVSPKGAAVPSHPDAPSSPPIAGQAGDEEIKEEKVDIPMDASAYHHFLLAQFSLSEDAPEKALQEYQQALEHDPTSAVLQTELATVYLKQGNFDEATDQCKQALTNNAEYLPAKLLLARIYLHSKDYEAAIAQYESILALNPEKQEIYLYLGNLYTEKQDYEKAIEILKTLIQRDPSSLMGLYYLYLLL